MFPIKCTVFFTSVTVLKNTVRLIGNIEYVDFELTIFENSFTKVTFCHCCVWEKQLSLSNSNSFEKPQ